MALKRPTRLTLVTSSLACGGVQRVVCTLAGEFAARGHSVTIATLAPATSDFFPLPKGVARISLNQSGERTPWPRLLPAVLTRLVRLRRALRDTRPDVVIAHQPRVNAMALLSLVGHRCPVIVTEHGDVSTRQGKGAVWTWRKRSWYRLRRLIYPLAARVVSVSQAVDHRFEWLPAQRRHVIHNPFHRPAPHTAPTLPAGVLPGRQLLIAVGRLSHAKGFDLLLRAFARVAADFRDWQLLIVGDGERREALQHLAAELGLERQVVFAGAVAEPLPLMRQAELFVMASRYEGFPMAHGEALACGVPVLATDCPSHPVEDGTVAAGGVRELVRHAVDGWLVPPADPAAFAEALARLLSDPQWRRRLARRAPEVTQRFAAAGIVETWERVISELVRWGRVPTATHEASLDAAAVRETPR